eukprot:TRINITY_DN11634_c0_g1_i2.p1 TRINITY_DN11634_c0_g1~~TRINITY_DN11634_c0_g1_i2.p1  ORF type:complete len:157 (+),score=23.16 TRINITY_DN11634_c0_g1_i2:2-472(+)
MFARALAGFREPSALSVFKRSMSVSATITTTWDSKALKSNDQVKLKIEPDQAGQQLKFHIDAPFYNDPPPPHEVESTPQLWDYEVVEAFFLGKDDRYLEIEVGPAGHYIALELHGSRNLVRDHMPLEVTTKIAHDAGEWEIDTALYMIGLGTGMTP